MSNEKKITKLLPTVAYMTGPVLSILILPLVTRTLRPEEYGVYNYYILLINYILLFTFFPSINSFVLRFCNTNFPDYKNDKVIILKVVAFTSIAYFLVSLVLFSIFQDWLFFYVAVAYYIINIVTYYKSFLNVNGKKMKFSILVLSIVLAQYIAVFLAYCFWDLMTFHLLIGNVIMSIVLISYILYKNGKKIHCLLKTKIDADSYKKILKFVIPSIGIVLSGIILTTGDRIIIKNLIENGDYYVGVYAINYTLYAQVIDVIVAVFYLYIPSYLYLKFEKQGIHEYLDSLKGVTNLYLIVSTMITILVLFNYDKVNYLLFDSQYNVNSKLSLYVLLGQHYFGVYRIISNYYLVINKIKILTYILGVTAVLNIILNIIFVPVFGYIAAAVTTLICYVLLFVISYIFIYKSTKKHIINLYNLILLAVPLVLLIFVSEPNIYNDKIQVIIDIVLQSFVIVLLYSLLNYKHIKFFVKNRLNRK